MNRSLAIAASVWLVSACSDPLVITCDPARLGAECLQGGISGECVATCDDSAHYCAFSAPHDCPETGLAYGALSGSYSETCVETCALAADGGPDAAAGDAAAPDGGGALPPATVYVTLNGVNEMRLFGADDLTSLGSVSLPPTQPQGYGLFGVDHFLWLVSQSHIVKYDVDTKLVAPGYPRYFGASDSCQPLTSVFGPEGWTCIDGSTVQRWTGEPLVQGPIRSASSPNYLARSTKRIYSVEGGQAFDQIVVYDANTLNEVPGSPIALDGSRFVFADSEMDRVAVVSWSNTAPGLYLFRESTLEPMGFAAVSPSTVIWTVGFDTRRHHVVASEESGFLTVYSGDDLSLLSPPTSVSTSAITRLRYDASRDRFYATAGLSSSGSLVVLEGESLTNVTGSPAALDGIGQALVLR